MGKRKAMVFLAALFVVTMVFMPTQGISGDAQLIKIVPEQGAGFYIDPPTVNIKVNTVVVWLNGVTGKDLKIVFEQGRTCKDVTANPNVKQPGFYLDSKNCYVTSFLSYAATSTLQFPEAGEFEYKVVTEDGSFQAKGEIRVR